MGQFSVLAAVVGLALLATPAAAQMPSGGASGGGADQGGSGPPGSGTGVPGSLGNGTSATGIGTSATTRAGARIRTHHHRRHRR